MTDIVKYPDVFLRTVSSPVKFPLDDKTERLIKWMIKVMYKNEEEEFPLKQQPPISSV